MFAALLVAPAFALDLEMEIAIDSGEPVALFVEDVLAVEIPLLRIGGHAGVARWVAVEVTKIGPDQVQFLATVTRSDPRQDAIADEDILSRPRVTALIGKEARVAQESRGKGKGRELGISIRFLATES